MMVSLCPRTHKKQRALKGMLMRDKGKQNNTKLDLDYRPSDSVRW